jgi:hypothetical protein
LGLSARRCSPSPLEPSQPVAGGRPLYVRGGDGFAPQGLLEAWPWPIRQRRRRYSLPVVPPWFILKRATTQRDVSRCVRAALRLVGAARMCHIQQKQPSVRRRRKQHQHQIEENPGLGSEVVFSFCPFPSMLAPSRFAPLVCPLHELTSENEKKKKKKKKRKEKIARKRAYEGAYDRRLKRGSQAAYPPSEGPEDQPTETDAAQKKVSVDCWGPSAQHKRVRFPHAYVPIRGVHGRGWWLSLWFWA